MVNVFDLDDGRTHFINPDIRDLMGNVDYPLWFIREVNAQLAAGEPYTVASGVGMLVLYAPWVVEDYPDVTPGRRSDTPHTLCSDWCDRVAGYYRDNIVDSLMYEVDDLLEGLKTATRLFARDIRAALYSLRALKLRRDSLESVAWVSAPWDNVVRLEIKALDEEAKEYRNILADDRLTEPDRRLSTVYQMNPNAWWALRPSL